MKITYTQHAGLSGFSQQDALWNGQEVIQTKNCPVSEKSFPTHVIAGVADGLACHPRSALASRYVMSCLKDKAAASLDRSWLQSTHSGLCDRYARGTTTGIASTFAGATLWQNQWRSLNCGDSRVYLFRASGQHLQISKDHTILADLISSGEAEQGCDYARFYDALNACLIADDQESELRCHISTTQWQPGDRVLVCTDGAYEELGNQLYDLYASVLTADKQLTLWRDEIISTGAQDNFSMILVEKDIDTQPSDSVNTF